jgi:transcriptional regulator
MVLTRKQRESLVLDLYNQGKTIREIAQEVRMSFSGIGAILKKATEENEQAKSKQKRCPKQHKHTNSFLTVNLP